MPSAGPLIPLSQHCISDDICSIPLSIPNSKSKSQSQGGWSKMEVFLSQVNAGMQNWYCGSMVNGTHAPPTWSLHYPQHTPSISYSKMAAPASAITSTYQLERKRKREKKEFPLPLRITPKSCVGYLDLHTVGQNLIIRVRLAVRHIRRCRLYPGWRSILPKFQSFIIEEEEEMSIRHNQQPPLQIP